MGKNAERCGILISTSLRLTHASRKKQAITHEDVSDTREHVQAMRIKLDEIHKWYEENLKRPPQSPGSPRPPSYASFDAGSFTLYEEQGNHGEAEAISCPHARFEDLWAGGPDSQTDKPRRSIFKCGCSSTAGSHNLQYTCTLGGNREFYRVSNLIYPSLAVQCLCSGDW